ncbi:MAG TPA: TatD family hydrolase [Candidatus Binatia bacterium]|nr:TatD family hydrolase [Candidatus Binatia bacterium]
MFTGLLASSRDFLQVAQSLQRLHHQAHLLDAYAELARETKLPLVVHDRDAHREIAELLRVEGG